MAARLPFPGARPKHGRRRDRERAWPMNHPAVNHPSRHAASTPDKPAYIVAETGETLTYGQLDRRSNQGAQLLFSLGLRPGDHVALLLENGLPFVETTWAAERAGLIYTAISRYLKAEEIAYIVRDCGAKVFITSPACLAEAQDLAGAP